MKFLITALFIFLYQLHFSHSNEDVMFYPQTDVFQSGVPFIGKYVGTLPDTPTWSSPDSCTQTPVTDTIEQFVCTSGGETSLQLTAGSTSINYTLDLERNYLCYTWGHEFSESTLSIWVKNISGDPDSDLSFEFYVLGESPKVSLHCDKADMDLPRGRFDLVSKSWDISLNESIEICSGVNVRGVPVVLNGCSVADLSAPIFRKRLPIQKNSVPAKSNTYTLCTDDCGGGVTVYLNNSHVFISTDRMASSNLLFLDHTVTDCGVTSNGTVLLLVNGGDTILVLEDFLVKKTISLSFSAEQITVNRKCLRKMETSYRVSPVVIWNTAKFTVFLDNDVAEATSSLPNGMKEISAVTVSYFGVEMVLRNKDENIWVSYDYLTASFETGSKLPVDCRKGCKLHRICPHMTWLEVDSNKPYLVTANGQSVSPVRSYLTGKILTISILSIAISSGDEFAIISGDKDFYLGYCSRSSVIEVAQGVGRARALLFDGPTEVKYIDDAGAAVSLPSRSLLKEALNFKTCPLKDFQSSLSSSLMYLDKGESWNYNISLTAADHQRPGLLYQLYPQGHARVNISSKFSTSANVHADNIFFKSLDKKGLSVIIASPEAADPQCSSDLTDTTYVVVDCPKTRSLEVRNRPSCNHYSNMSMRYTIPGVHRSDGYDTTVDYDLQELGCPIIWAYDENFLPDLWIFDNGKPTRQLCSDFTIREVNGRNDYNMTMSVSDVGCRRAPQTWLNMGDSWGPDNYQNCFDSEKLESFTKQEGNRQYEILNISCSDSNRKSNKISFGKHKANYTFEVVVLDPSASYCRLSTKFSVWILDAPNASDVGILVLFLACLVMLVILALSYFHYKRTILTKANMVLQS
ncbi:hypothetical protein ACHWQZ_G014030 [Mnemiopsis leidyi]